MIKIIKVHHFWKGTRRSSYFRHCVTSRKIAGSIPDCIFGVNSVSDRNKCQEYFLWGKGDRCVELTTLPPSRADCFEIWEPQPPGTLRACPHLLYFTSSGVRAVAVLGLLDSEFEDIMILRNVGKYPTTESHISEDVNLEQHPCENLKGSMKCFNLLSKMTCGPP